MVTGTHQQLSRFQLEEMDIAGSTLPISGAIKLLGVTFDRHLNFDKHISKIVRFYPFCAIRHIRHTITFLTFKTFLLKSPTYLYDLISRHEHTRSLHSSSTGFLNIPVAGSRLAGRGFCHAAPYVWNALPPELVPR
ncbi:hypothetical protein HELRODRAFT_163619 [Helobdella robusta]|uniref:Uncharacterized protein n=1 Tax=Helobdella robusta TaxID=6412 RepID=T1EUA3_HELRO|nr:hypothetical protein HELRODRAFT_163619 [Helobdella robusta]ESN96545.1 hypothetical protein HELRODRAFT_163619 [Helobdella robusta]